MDARSEDKLSQTVNEARVEVSHDGRVVAAAEVTSSAEPHGTAKVAFRSPHTDVVPDARGDLVDKVLDQPGVRNSDKVHVVVPLGDSAAITRLQQRTNNFNARAAGSSSIIEAEVAEPADDD